MFIKLYKSRKACIPFLCLYPPSCLRPHLSYENKFLINEHVKEDCNIWSDISSWIHRILWLTCNYIWAYSFLRAQSLKSVVSTIKLSWPDNTYSRGKTISSVFCFGWVLLHLNTIWLHNTNQKNTAHNMSVNAEVTGP